MLFNSFEFLVFLPVAFALYWLLSKQVKWQNGLLLLASYVFYGWWDWRFLSLIVISTVVDFWAGNQIFKSENQKQRKRFLWLSIAVNIGLLGFFKYFNFFVDSWIDAWSMFGYDMDTWTLNIVLPVGISFYTFQTMSYSLDIYRRQLEPTRDLPSFAAYVAFFPQLVAGPIERASNLLPQILNKRTFSYEQAMGGAKLILWGFFKKVVIADSLARRVDEIFANYETHDGSTLVLGAIMFGIQIYGDFSGYSDIAIGTSKLFGIELSSNFKFPYFSRDIAEFWRRWHISLSSWFRDYLYIPLGGSRVGNWMSFRNVLIIFLVSGLWHGANWTFVVWGACHAFMFLPLFVTGMNRRHVSNIVAENSWLPSVREIAGIVVTFALVTFAWIFFRSPDVGHAFGYIEHIGHNLFSLPDYKSGIPHVFAILVLDWTFRRNERKVLSYPNKVLRLVSIMLISAVLIDYFLVDKTPQSFIYFQF